jgi:hypothetical protein
MKSIVEELVLHNSYLAGRLEQSTGEVTNKETAILSAVNKSLQVSKRLETAIKKTAQFVSKQTSYAERVKMTSKKVVQMAVRPPRIVVIIRLEEEDSDIKTSEEACDAVFTLVNPRKSYRTPYPVPRKKIQVTAVRKLSGDGLVVGTTKPQSLKAFTENEKLKEAGLKASTPQRKPPRMIMYDIPRDIPEKEILACMIKAASRQAEPERRRSHQILLQNGTQGPRGDQLGNGSTPSPQVREKLLQGKIFISCTG